MRWDWTWVLGRKRAGVGGWTLWVGGIWEECLCQSVVEPDWAARGRVAVGSCPQWLQVGMVQVEVDVESGFFVGGVRVVVGHGHHRSSWRQRAAPGRHSREDR